MVIVTNGSANMEFDQTENKISQILPPLPPGFIGNATPNENLKSDYILSDNLILESNQIQLYPGWNMISSPLWLQSGYNTALAVFGGVNTGGHSIWYYDGQQQAWAALQADTLITPLTGYWVYSTEPTVITLHFDSSQPIPSKQLYSTWNFIGVWNLQSHSARETLISVNSIWSVGYGFDPVHQIYETSFINGGSGTHTDTALIFPTKGYWLFCTGNGILQPIAGTKDYLDSEYPQVGVEWANDYFWPLAPLSYCDDTASGFYSTLGNASWIKMFNFGDSNNAAADFLFEDDWHRIDGVDVAFFSGHGQDWNVKLGSDPSKWVLYSYSSWGDNDLEWIFLHGCYTTKTPNNFKGFPHWAMNGVHLVSGYYSEGWDTNDGVNIANRLLAGETVKNAWFNAVDESSTPPIVLQVIGETDECGNDHIWGEGSVVSDPQADNEVTTWMWSCS